MVLRVIHAWDTSQVFLKASFFVQLVQLVGILFISAEVGDKVCMIESEEYANLRNLDKHYCSWILGYPIKDENVGIV